MVARIYPMILPQQPTYPAVTYQRIDGPRESALNSDMGIPNPRIQIDAWGSSYASALAVAEQIRAALVRQVWTENGVSVLDALIDDDRDLFEDDVQEGGQRIFRRSLDLIIRHRE